MYRTICCEFWTDPDVAKLTKDERHLALYLITNPHSHVSGIYYISMPTMVEETKMNRRVIEGGLKALRRGIEGGSKGVIAHYDHVFKQVWVVNMLEYQGRGQNVEKAVASHLMTLHGSPLITPYLQRYPSVSRYLPNGFNDNPLRRGIEGGSKGVPDFPSPVPDPDSSLNPLVLKDGECEGKIEWVVREWGRICGVKPVVKLGPALRTRIQRYVQEHPEEAWWNELFMNVGLSDFLCGRSSDFAASLDWILGPKNFEKYEAGNYKNRTAMKPKAKSMLDLL